MSPTAAVTTGGLNASLASAPTVMGMSFARVRGRVRARRVRVELKCMVKRCLMMMQDKIVDEDFLAMSESRRSQRMTDERDWVDDY